MRTAFIVLAAAGAAIAQEGYVNQIPDGQVQAPTGSYELPETTAVPAPVESAPVESAPVEQPTEVAPEPYSSVPVVSTPAELSTSYEEAPPAVETSIPPVPLPVPVNTTAPVAPAPTYPAGNGTVVGPTGSGAPTTIQTGSSPSETEGSPVGGSETSGSAQPEQTGNGAGMIGVQTGALAAVFAAALAFLA